MDKLRIAVYIDFAYDKQIGGAFTYFKYLIQRIDNYTFDGIIEIFFLDRGENNVVDFKKPLMHIPYQEIVQNRESIKIRLQRYVFSLPILKHFGVIERINRHLDKMVQRDITRFLMDKKIDFIYYPFPNFKPYLYPFVATSWDVGYKSSWVTKAPYSTKHYEWVERYYRETLAKSLAIIVESEAGKEEHIYFERYNPEKLFILPLIPSLVVHLRLSAKSQLEILSKFKLKQNEFYFYPAQFWPHKNHFGLLHAFSKLLIDYPNFKMVFTGSDKGNYNYIIELVKSLGILNNVIFAGYVDDESIYTFYKNAIGLVMPSLMGPTNMPPLEAAILGCNVACSELKGHREQLGEYATYFDANSIEDIYIALKELLFKQSRSFNYQGLEPEITLNEIFKKLYVPAKISGHELPHGI